MSASISRQPSATTRGTWRKVFANEGVAEVYLAERGFSVGRRQGGAERGILLGSYDIQKWRNLSPADRVALHGVLQRQGFDLGSPAAITIYAAAPAEAHEAIKRTAEQVAALSGAKVDDALEMLISPDIDPEHVQLLAAAFVTASDEWHDKTGKPKLAREMAEAALVNLCDILQGAPDEATRAAMANQAIGFIMRNCGASAMDVFLAHRAEMEGEVPFQPMGSA